MTFAAAPTKPWKRALSAAALGLLACAPPEGIPSDVLLVTIDTLRADRVGAYGYSQARTPTLDRLAAQGVRFAVAVAPTPITLPSHASILTAKLPPFHGVRDNGAFRLPEAQVTLAERLADAGYATGAFVGAFVLASDFGLSQGFEVYDDEMGGDASGAIGYPERSARAVVDAALGWIESLPPDRPWLAWLHFYDPHSDYSPPPGFAAAFPGRPYDGEIAYVDFQLGRLLESLGAQEPSRSRIVAVTADHGESLGEHGEPSHTRFLYDATQLVPLLLAGAGLPRGVTVEAQVRVIDLAPTLLDLLGLEPLPGTQGASLLPMLAGGEREVREAYLETLAPRSLGWSPLLGLRLPGEKYIRAPRPELYDLVADPRELHNLHAARAERARELDARLEELLQGAGSSAAPTALSPEAEARLRALGYVVPDPGQAGAPVRVEGLDPKDGIAQAARFDRAGALFGGARFREAAELARELRREAPGAPLYLSFEAMVRLARGEAKEAARLAREAARLAPAEAANWILLGDSERRLGRWEPARAALETAERVRRAHPSLAKAWVELLLDQGLVEEARERVETGLRDRPRDPKLLGLRGWVFEAEGDEPAARTAYRAALDHPGENDLAALRLARLHIGSGEIEAGKALLRGVPVREARALDAALELSEAYARVGQLEEALATLRPLAEDGIEAPELWVAYVGLLERAGRASEAQLARHRASQLSQAELHKASPGD